MVCWESWFGSQEIDSTQQKWELTGSWLHIFSPPFWSLIFPSIYREIWVKDWKASLLQFSWAEILEE